MVNKKFKVIEEGRLNKQSLGEIKGGWLCTPTDESKYTVVLCKKLYAVCPKFYMSCLPDNGYTECKGEYKGLPGPDGYLPGVVLPKK